MTGDEIRAAHRPFTDLLRGGVFRASADDWTAECVAAHVALNNDEFTRVADAVRRGERPVYDNAIAVDEHRLRTYADESGGLPRLAEAVEESARRLARARDALSAEQAATEVHLRIRDGGELVRDAPGPIGEWIDGNASFHLEIHLDQLRGLQAGA